ncbi:hypothetical protein BKA70DRAFT_1232030 [Coprinopsis sp. MPI-PUGE-AT-0042]|nr:hypothetical protein BKA70DRAFT_1232030 [Coprinopsis sp. MPI-PUGE-AT-0042]
MEHETELRKRIQELLFDYSRTHYTRDYAEFTVEVVLDFLESLDVIPTNDPFALALPTDPLKTFFHLNKVDDLSPLDERWKIPRESIALIKSAMRTTEKPKTERVILEDNQSDLELPDLPLSFMLPARARRATPHPGKGAYKRGMPTTFSNMLTGQLRQESPRVEDVADAKVSLDRVLKTSFVVDEAEIGGVAKIGQATIQMLKPRSTPRTYMPRLDSPPLEVEEPGFMPFVPRIRRPGYKPDGHVISNIPQSAAELEPMLSPAPVHSSDDHLHLKSMAVVDHGGWTGLATFHSSQASSDSDSPPSSQGEAIDELEYPLTPDTDPPVDTCEPIVMEDFLPKFYVRRQRKSRPNGKQVSTFDAAPSSDLDVQIQRICPGVDPTRFILEEKIDDKALDLMEVPSLPEPNEHPVATFMPTSYQDWAACKSADPHKDNETAALFLQESTDTAVSVSVAIMDRGVQERTLDQTLITNVEKLSNLVALPDDEDPMSRKCSRPGQDISCSIDDIEEPLLLSRLERTRRSGKRKLSLESADSHSPESTPPTHPFQSPIGPDFDGAADAGCPSASLGPALKYPKRRRLESVSQDRSNFDQQVYADALEVNTHEYLPDMPDDSYDIEDAAIEAFRLVEDPFSGDDKENWDPIIGGFADGVVMQADGTYPLDEVSGGMAVTTAGSQEEGYAENADFNPRMAQSDGPSIEGDNSMADSRFGTVDDSFDALDFDTQFKGPTQAIHTVSPSPMALASPAPPESLASQEAVTKQNKATLPSLFNCTLSALAFSHLRAAQAHATPAASDSIVLVEEDPLFEATVENIAPEEIYDRHTIRLKDGAPAPAFGHRYLASLDLLQKRALVKELGSKNCAVDLIERQSLDGTHLILDPFTAVVFVPLLTLPSTCTDWVNTIVAQAQKYTFINIIFEAYPESCALRSKERESEISAYTPPIMKAIKIFRRDIGISEAYSEHIRRCSITYAFADTVRDAARLVRLYGDLAEGRDTSDGVLWDDRLWLDAEQSSEVSLEEFVNETPESRLAIFGRYVGDNTIASFNQELQKHINDQGGVGDEQSFS